MGLKFNLSHEYLGNTLTNIIIVMLKVGFNTSPYRTTSTPENLGATIEKMAHDIPTICSWFSNDFFVSIVRTLKFLSS